jgi:hypothetical protein
MSYLSNIPIVNDANGTAYAVLADNGVLWQGQWKSEANRRDTGQVVSGSFGGQKRKAITLGNLWPTGRGGGAHAGRNGGLALAVQNKQCASPVNSLVDKLATTSVDSFEAVPHHGNRIKWILKPWGIAANFEKLACGIMVLKSCRRKLSWGVPLEFVAALPMLMRITPQASS